MDFIALLILNSYDSTFKKLLPKFKESSKHISTNERVRIAQTLEGVWEMYFYINEALDINCRILYFSFCCTVHSIPHRFT